MGADLRKRNGTLIFGQGLVTVRPRAFGPAWVWGSVTSPEDAPTSSSNVGGDRKVEPTTGIEPAYSAAEADRQWMRALPPRPISSTLPVMTPGSATRYSTPRLTSSGCSQG